MLCLENQQQQSRLPLHPEKSRWTECLLWGCHFRSLTLSLSIDELAVMRRFPLQALAQPVLVATKAALSGHGSHPSGQMDPECLDVS